MNKIVILDFGSQVTQLIGRRLRELNVFCEIYPFNKVPALDSSVKGVILSGGEWVELEKGSSVMVTADSGQYKVYGKCEALLTTV